ncbi:MAG: DUF1501 domain-containing protein [Clostridia bacterium]
MTLISRRDFIIRSGAFLLGLGLGDSLLAQLIQPDVVKAATRTAANPVLVVVQLSGGNDGINTLIPFQSGIYYDKRPTIGIKQEDVLPLNQDVALHPSLVGIHELYTQGKVAVIQGVGYPDPDRSHFRSMDIWHTADPAVKEQHGWLGRYLELSNRSASNPVRAIEIGPKLSLALSGNASVPCIQQLAGYRLTKDERLLKSFKQMYKMDENAALSTVKTRGNSLILSVERLQGIKEDSVGYPQTSFAQDLATAAAVIKGGLGTEILYTQLGSFDDHAAENNSHPALLQELDQAIRFFYQDLSQAGIADNVTMLLFSEFGRRLTENGSGGTDHGTAGPVLMIGNKVKGGLYGEYPSLSKLTDGDLNYTVDFRSIYASVIDGWMSGSHQDVLGKTYETLPVFR